MLTIKKHHREKNMNMKVSIFRKKVSKENYIKYTGLLFYKDVVEGEKKGVKRFCGLMFET